VLVGKKPEHRSGKSRKTEANRETEKQNRGSEEQAQYLA
jgi:hypothetical protein